MTTPTTTSPGNPHHARHYAVARPSSRIPRRFAAGLYTVRPGRDEVTVEDERVERAGRLWAAREFKRVMEERDMQNHEG